MGGKGTGSLLWRDIFSSFYVLFPSPPLFIHRNYLSTSLSLETTPYLPILFLKNIFHPSLSLKTSPPSSLFLKTTPTPSLSLKTTFHPSLSLKTTSPLFILSFTFYFQCLVSPFSSPFPLIPFTLFLYSPFLYFPFSHGLYFPRINISFSSEFHCFNSSLLFFHFPFSPSRSITCSLPLSNMSFPLAPSLTISFSLSLSLFPFL